MDVNRKQTKVQAKLSKLNETPRLTRGLYGLRSREQLHNIGEFEGLDVWRRGFSGMEEYLQNLVNRNTCCYFYREN